MAARKKMIDIPFNIPIPILLDEHFTGTAGAITLIKKYGILLWVMIRRFVNRKKVMSMINTQLQ